MKLLQTVFPLLLFFLSEAQVPGIAPLDKIALDTRQLLLIELPSDSLNEIVRLDLKNKTAVVLVFLSPMCPISRKYALLLNNLFEKYSTGKIGFYGVFSGSNAEVDIADTFRQDYAIQFPILLDKNFRLAEITGATITPEVCIIDSTGFMLYRGMIDNWFVALGKKRKVITEHYLQDSLEMLTNAREVDIPYNKAIGCLIHPF